MSREIATSVSELIQPFGWALVHFLWQGALIAVVLAFLFAMIRKQSAESRYVLACVALAAMALCPIVTTNRLAGSESRVVFPGIRSAAPLSVDRAFTPVSEQPSPEASFRLDRAIPWLVAVWLAGSGLLSFRLLVAWTALSRLTNRGSRVVEGALADRLHCLATRFGIRARVTLLESRRAIAPGTYGVCRTVILLPASVVAGMPANQIEAVLAHELAHIRRHDYLVNLVQSFIETLLFYHPAVWWVSRQIRIEREHCCDDLAIHLLGERASYAHALARLEELRGAPLAMAASGGPLLARIRRITQLGESHMQTRFVPAWLAGSLSVAAAVAGFAFFTLPAQAGKQQAQPPATPPPAAAVPSVTQPAATPPATSADTTTRAESADALTQTVSADTAPHVALTPATASSLAGAQSVQIRRSQASHRVKKHQDQAIRSQQVEHTDALLLQQAIALQQQKAQVEVIAALRAEEAAKSQDKLQDEAAAKKVYQQALTELDAAKADKQAAEQNMRALLQQSVAQQKSDLQALYQLRAQQDNQRSADARQYVNLLALSRAKRADSLSSMLANRRNRAQSVDARASRSLEEQVATLRAQNEEMRQQLRHLESELKALKQQRGGAGNRSGSIAPPSIRAAVAQRTVAAVSSVTAQRIVPMIAARGTSPVSAVRMNVLSATTPAGPVIAPIAAHAPAVRGISIAAPVAPATITSPSAPRLLGVPGATPSVPVTAPGPPAPPSTPKR